MGGKLRRGAIGVLVWSGLAAAPMVAAADPPAEPVLRIETGAHQSTVNRILPLPDGRFLTVSDDQTARVWRSDGQLAHTVRGAADARDGGALYAAAASGEYLALGGRAGWDWEDNAASVRMLDVQTLRPRGVLSGLPGPVSALAFSVDGARLAVGMLGQAGLRVYALGEGRAALTDSDFRQGVSDTAFGPAGRLYAIDQTGHIRAYDAGLNIVADATLPAGFDPWRMAVSPDGALLAIGSRSGAQIALVRADGLGVVRYVQVSDQPGAAHSVAWSRDGRTVYAAGVRADGRAEVWSVPADGGPAVAIGQDGPPASAIMAGDDGAILYADSDGGWSRLSPSGRLEMARGTAKLDFRSASSGALRVSEDGGVVEVTAAGGRIHRFSMRERAHQAGAAAGEPASPPPPGLSDGWRGAQTIRLNGAPVAMEPNERALSAAVTAADTAEWALGSNFYIRAYRGALLQWRTAAPAPVWSVAASGDGRFVIAALGDGTLRWLNARTGAVELSVFLHPDGQRWVLWSPDGFYDFGPMSADSGAAAGFVGYHFNNGYAEEARFVRISQTSRDYFRPDLVRAIYRGGPDATSAMQSADLGPGESAASVLARTTPPRVIVEEVCGVLAIPNYYTDGSSAYTRQNCQRADAFQGDWSRPVPYRFIQSEGETEGMVELIVRVEDGGGGVGDVEVRHNVARVEAATRDAEMARSLEDANGRREVHRLHLAPGANGISVAAYDAEGKVRSAPVELTIADVAFEQRAREPQLRILAIGVSDYQYDVMYDLGTAANDADSISRVLTSEGNRGYVSKAPPIILRDSEATRERIGEAFEQLAREANPEDVVVVFLAGHGDVISGDYHFAPHDVGASTKGRWEEVAASRDLIDSVRREAFVADGVSQTYLTAALGKIRARRVVAVLDTCFAGTFDQMQGDGQDGMAVTATQRVAQSTGRFVITSARGLAADQADGPDSHNSLFTTEALMGLEGGGDLDRDGAVSLIEFATYVRGAVLRASENSDVPQYPQVQIQGDAFFVLTQYGSQ